MYKNNAFSAKVPTSMQGNRSSIIALTFEEVEKIPELKVRCINIKCFMRRIL